MKLQGFSVIFTLVCIPLLLVLSYYISLQVDTITLQNEYNSKLLSATYDAVSAFELNTANEDLSTVSDSLRTIIEASNSIFFNTLSTNMGLSNASKSYVEPYIPSVLYTLYDGYYIFAPTTIPVVKTDEDGVALTAGQDFVSYDETTGRYSYIPKESQSDSWKSGIHNGDDLCNPNDYGQILYVDKDRDEDYNDELTSNPAEAKTKIKNVLKSYMPYSARYKASKEIDDSIKNTLIYKASGWNGPLTYDINIIYTLDNFITVEGYVQHENNKNSRVYYTESGYLLKGDNVIVKIGNPGTEVSNYNQNDIQRVIEYSDGTEVTIGIGDIELSTNNLSTVDNIINDYGKFYELIGEDERAGIDGGADVVDENIARLNFLTTNSDRWNEKSLKEKYEVFLTILRNRYDDIANMERKY